MWLTTMLLLADPALTPSRSEKGVHGPRIGLGLVYWNAVSHCWAFGHGRGPQVCSCFKDSFWPCPRFGNTGMRKCFVTGSIFSGRDPPRVPMMQISGCRTRLPPPFPVL